MTDYSWTTLEDAVIEALGAALGTQVKTLETFQGDWRGDLVREGRRLPAVLVMLQHSRAEQVTGQSFDVTLDFTLIVAARQLRGEAAGRRHSGGVYDLLAGVRQALWGQDLGLEILPFTLLREEPLLNTREFTVYGAHYRTGLVREVGS